MNYDAPTTRNMDCAHKVADHRHGTNVCYVHDLCRCEECTAAARRYERHRRRWVGEFPHAESPYVGADQARKLVSELQARGVGLKRIVMISGVAQGTLWKLMYGVPGRGPSKRCRQSTVDRLAHALDALIWEEATLADGARVDGTEARLIINELVARGWKKAEISRYVTGDPEGRSLQVAKTGGQVEAVTLRRLRELMRQDHLPERTHPTGKTYQPTMKRRARPVARMVDGVGGPTGTLTAEQRIVDLLDVEGWMSYAAIADRLGLSEKSIGTLVNRLDGQIEKRTVTNTDSPGWHHRYTEARVAS